MSVESDALMMSLGLLGVFGIGFLIFWLYMYRRTSMLAKIIYQDSESTFRFLNKPIINDTIKIGEKTFSTSGVKPKSVRTRWGWMPLFRFKYNIPFALPFEEIEEVEIQPEALTRLGELATLDKILKPRKTSWQEMMIYIALGLALGIVIGFVIVATGAIPIGQTTPAPSYIIPPAPTSSGVTIPTQVG
jgi:hypothetical protein